MFLLPSCRLRWQAWKAVEKGEQTALSILVIVEASLIVINWRAIYFASQFAYLRLSPHPILLSPSQVLYSNVTSISYAAQMWLEPGKVQLSFTAHLMLPHNDAVANCAGFSNWSFSLCFFFLTTSTVDLPHIGDAISKSAQQQQRSFLPLPKPFVEQTMWTLLPRGAD